MKSGKAVCRYLSIVFLALCVWYALPHLGGLASARTKAESEQAGRQESTENCINSTTQGTGDSPAVRPKNRAESLRAIVSYLGLGKSSAIADIGAGNGRDTWVFAEIVGEGGKVYPEEIGEDTVRSLKASAEKKELAQVFAVSGRSDDPCLPADSIDLAYMNRVYHHFAKPREMLRGIWRSLKPGGYLVIVDQWRGTLRDWVPRHVRQEKHYWIAETTVVREAREEGFNFFACPDQLWHEKDPFVLVFRHPEKLENPGGDPDPFQPISVENWRDLFLPSGGRYQNPVFIALGQARELMVPILEHSSGEGLDIVLEEWATQKDERPPVPAGLSLPSVLTKDGDPNLPNEPIDVVFFLDSYHLLFHGKTLLARLREKLMPTGRIYVLDRRAGKPLTRREASHRRQIEPKTVEEEMAEAGFRLWFRGQRLARDRFLLVFGLNN
ncbi:MAG: methyltransferase domain-containing protein [Sedimentisphaerales bacterium]|nr:methyltransferase domain-containing protein [Sedimentisphaerales bacterium]